MRESRRFCDQARKNDAERRKEDREKANRKPRGTKNVSGPNLGQQTNGKTEDAVAAATGFSHGTMAAIAKVVAAAEKDPTLAPVVEEMDREEETRCRFGTK